jgi:hypothetical protein
MLRTEPWTGDRNPYFRYNETSWFDAHIQKKRNEACIMQQLAGLAGPIASPSRSKAGGGADRK